MVIGSMISVNAVGIWFYSVNTERYLYLLRNDPKHPGSWGLPGGKVEGNETLLQAMERECLEELGMLPNWIKVVPLEKFTTADSKFAYHTFFCPIVDEFCPSLNDEHLGWAWVDSGHWPKPMHPGLWSMVNFDIIQDKIAILRSTLQTSQ